MFRRRAVCLLAALAIGVSSHPAVLMAQRLSLLVPGQRVRITLPERREPAFNGQFRMLHGDTVVLRTPPADSDVAVPRARIHRLEAYVGQRNRTVLGGVIGLVLGAAIERNDDPSSRGRLELVGGLVGALIGFRIRSERWVDVPIGRDVALGRLDEVARWDSFSVAATGIPLGRRVRVTPLAAAGWTQEGALLRLESDTLVIGVAGGGPVSIATDHVGRLDAFQGLHRHTGIGAAIGGTLGLVGAVVAGVQLAKNPCFKNQTAQNWDCFFTVLFGPMMVIGLPFGGAGAGALVGSLVVSEQWQSVPLDRLRAAILLPPGGRPYFGMSLAF